MEKDSNSSVKSNVRRLFIDPASISSGWAYFNDKELLAHGTIATPKEFNVWTRLADIVSKYRTTMVDGSIDEVHIELLPRRCHIYTHYSVACIGYSLYSKCGKIHPDIPIKSWQKATDWNGKRKCILDARVHNESSEDELAAIGMGIYYTQKVAK